MTRSPRELANQKLQLRKQQEKLLGDLLAVVDALDRASEHWQRAEQNQVASAQHMVSQTTVPQDTAPLTFPWWQRWRQWFKLAKTETTDLTEPESDSLTEVVTSAREGIDMIRESMLSVLSQHQVEPLPAQGEPFDPSYMHALGQQVDAAVPPQTVVQEVVRGYRWQDRTLREAKVIVAIAPSEPDSTV